MSQGRPLDASAELRNLIKRALDQAVATVQAGHTLSPFFMTLHESGRPATKPANAPLDTLVAELPDTIAAYVHVSGEERTIDGFDRGIIRIEAEERDQPFAIRLAQNYRTPTARDDFRILGSPEYLGKVGNRLAARLDHHLEAPAANTGYVDIPMLLVEGMLAVAGGPSPELMKLLGALVNTAPKMRDQVPPALLDGAREAIAEAGGHDAALEHLVPLPPQARKTAFILAAEAACATGSAPDAMQRLQRLARVLGIDSAFTQKTLSAVQARFDASALIPPPLLAHAFLSVILADGRFDQEEMTFLNTFAQSLPDFGSTPLMSLLGPAQQAIQSTGGVIPSLSVLAGVPSDTAKQRCFYLTVELGYASELNEREIALLDAIGQALGLAPQVAHNIREVVSAKFA